jgi:hypothetical protein
MPIPPLQLAGFDEPLYKNIAERFFSSNMSLRQAILAGIYLLTIAETTSNWVKGPFTVAVINSRGISLEKPSFIARMRERLEHYEAWVNRIFLACADTTIHVSTLEQMLTEFSRAALLVHREQIDEVVKANMTKVFADMSDSVAHRMEPMTDLPDELVITLGPGVNMVHDPEERKRSTDYFKNVILPEIRSIPNRIYCDGCQLEHECILEDPESGKGVPSFSCLDCGKEGLHSLVGNIGRVRKAGTDEWKTLGG